MAHALEAPRLRVVPFQEEHLTARYVEWLRDPEVVRFSEQRFRSHTLESCRAFWQSFEGTPHRFWAIVSRGAEGHIGNITAHVQPRHAVADLGILVGERSVWGRGYGTEAWMAVCDHLLAHGGMRKVTAGTLRTNVGMLGIMRKSGMVPDGVRVGEQLFEGEPVDMIHAARFAKPYLQDHIERAWRSIL